MIRLSHFVIGYTRVCGVRGGGRVTNAGTGTPTSLMKGEQGVYLHYREVVPEQNECRDVNDILRAVPEMGEELGRSRGGEPDEVAQDYIPPRQMKASVIRRNRTLVNNVPNESRASKKSEGIEQLVNHRVRYIWVNGPDVSFHEKGPQIGPPSVSSPSKHLLQEPPVGLHCTEQFCFLAALHISTPAMADHPACKKLVVARVELVFAKPIVVSESV